MHLEVSEHFNFNLLRFVPVWTFAFRANSRAFTFIAGNPFMSAATPIGCNFKFARLFLVSISHYYLLVVYTKGIDKSTPDSIYL